MAFAAKGNAGGGSFKLYTGIAECEILAVCPNMKELVALGINAEKEPKYHTPGKGMRVAFLMKAQDAEGNEIKFTHSIFLEDKIVPSISMDKTGNFRRDSSSLKTPNWNPYNGEVELVSFLINYFNVGKDEEAFLEKRDALVKAGNVTELREMFKSAPENCTIKLLLGVRTTDDGKVYQSSYGGKTEKSWSTDYSYLHKNIVERQQYIKEDYGDINMLLYNPSDFILKEFVKNGANATPEPTSTGAVNGATAGAPVAAAITADEDEDPPF